METAENNLTITRSFHALMQLTYKNSSQMQPEIHQ